MAERLRIVRISFPAAPRRILRLTAVAGLALALAACQSSEERAEGHYQRGLELAEAGDIARASVEFRNVFRLNGRHQEARHAYAALLRADGRMEGAYGQYLRLVEQYPDDAEAVIALAEIAIDLKSWSEARRYGPRAMEMAPDAPATRAIAASLDYAAAIEAEDDAARRAAAEAALARLEAGDGDARPMLRILADSAIRDEEFEAALGYLDQARTLYPEDRTVLNTRLAVLARLERGAELEAQLLEMVEAYPDETEMVATLLRLYVSQGRSEEAEDFLRARAETAEAPEIALTELVQFILVARGPEAALAELDTILAEAGASPRFRGIRAGILFNGGDPDAAIADLESAVATLSAAQDAEAETAGEDREILNTLRVDLAQMLMVTGNAVGARRLVEEVLEDDAGQVGALRIKASWLIEEDQADEAVGLLRTALDAQPDDTAALSLMALAHRRNGNRELAREFLSLAVEASGNAPEPSIRYAEALVEADRLPPAEEVLTDALRLAPGDLSVLAALGDLYIRMDEPVRARRVETALTALDTPESTAAATALRTRRLAAEGRMDDAVAYLEDLAEAGGEAGARAQILVVRARLAAGDGAGAVRYAREALAAAPDDPSLQIALASAQAATGDYDAAEASYRAVLAVQPGIERLWVDLIRVLNAKGDAEGSRAALEEGLAALPEAADLLWVQASFAERSGDYEGAIALYERLYERLPNSDIVANNLASLLATYRDTPEALERAERVARRLRGTEVPQMQDTYGWIAFRRGDLDVAIDHLEPAAAALAEDPLVQYHLGMAYAAADRAEEAIATLERALEIAGEDTRPQFDTARAELERLRSAASGN